MNKKRFAIAFTAGLAMAGCCMAALPKVLFLMFCEPFPRRQIAKFPFFDDFIFANLFPAEFW